MKNRKRYVVLLAFLLLSVGAYVWLRPKNDTGLIELGKGKRQLWIGGKLDSEFLITVHEAFVHAN